MVITGCRSAFEIRRKTPGLGSQDDGLLPPVVSHWGRHADSRWTENSWRRTKLLSLWRLAKPANSPNMTMKVTYILNSTEYTLTTIDRLQWLEINVRPCSLIFKDRRPNIYTVDRSIFVYYTYTSYIYILYTVGLIRRPILTNSWWSHEGHGYARLRMAYTNRCDDTSGRNDTTCVMTSQKRWHDETWCHDKAWWQLVWLSVPDMCAKWKCECIYIYIIHKNVNIYISIFL